MKRAPVHRQRGPRHAITALLVALSTVAAADAHASNGPSEDDLIALQTSGAMTDCLDVVFVGDGYTAAQQDTFYSDAKKTAAGLLQFGPYADSNALVNTYALFVASTQSGADHPTQGIDVETAFDATFDSYNIEYLVTADTSAIIAAVSAVMPAYDVVVLIVNDPAYGGSGGEVPMVSMAAESLVILKHEFAHSIANLADEYEQSNPNASATDPEVNVASADHLHPLKWQHWVKEMTPIPTDIAEAIGPHEPVGAYEGARYRNKGMFRPAPQCLMRSLDQTFCPVCYEAILLAMAADTRTIRDHKPSPRKVQCTLPACPTFSLETAQVPDRVIRWHRDGKLIASGSSWQPKSGDEGQFVLAVEVSQFGDRVRSDPSALLTEEVVWQVEVQAAEQQDGPTSAPAPAGCAAQPVAAGFHRKAIGAMILLMAGLVVTRRRRRGKE